MPQRAKVLTLASGAALVALALLTGCGSSEPITIQPRTPAVLATECPRHHGTVAIERVYDRRGYADLYYAGFTQTGWNNVRANLEMNRPAAALLDDALRASLRQCGMLSEAPGTQLLLVALEKLEIFEHTGFSTESMTGNVRYEVVVLDPTGTRQLGRFKVMGGSFHSALDTTGFAEQSVSEAIASSLWMFLSNVARLPPPPSN